MHVPTPSRSRIVRHIGLLSVALFVAVAPPGQGLFGLYDWQLILLFYPAYLLAAWANDGHRVATVIGALAAGNAFFLAGVIIAEADEPVFNWVGLFPDMGILVLYLSIFAGLPNVLPLALFDVALERYDASRWGRPSGGLLPSWRAVARLCLVVGLVTSACVGGAVAIDAGKEAYDDYAACAPTTQGSDVQRDGLYRGAFGSTGPYYVAVDEDTVWIRDVEDGGEPHIHLPIINQTYQNGSLLIAAGNLSGGHGVTASDTKWFLFTDSYVYASIGQRPTAQNSTPLLIQKRNCDGIGVDAVAVIEAAARQVGRAT